MKTIIVLFWAASCMALGVEEYARFAVAQDSVNYGGGTCLDASAGVRLFQGPWQFNLDQTYRKTPEDNAALQRFSRNRSETTLAVRYQTGGITVRPDFRFTTDLDSSGVVLPRSEGIGERSNTVRPGLNLGWELPGTVKLNAYGRYWSRSVSGQDDQDLSWAETRAGGGAIWYTPLGIDLGVSGMSHNTGIDEVDFDETYSRVNFAASLAPRTLPTRTQVMADLAWSVQSGGDHNGTPLPDRATARVRAVQTLARNLTFNFTVCQTIDFDEDVTRLAAYQAGARLRYAFTGWGEHPSSVSLYGQGTESFISTRFGEIETRVGVYRGLSVLVNGRIWEGPSSIPGTGGTRRRETYGGGLEYRMKNGLSAWFLIRRQASELEYTEVWNSFQGGLAFYPAAHI
jgi:hypothetical protein